MINKNRLLTMGFSHHQIVLGENRQLVRPEEVEPGMRIEVARVMPVDRPRLLKNRAISALSGLALTSLHSSADEIIGAMRSGWSGLQDGGVAVVPQFRGTVTELYERDGIGGAIVHITHTIVPKSGMPTPGLSRVQATDQPVRFMDMGIAPQSLAHVGSPKWRSNVTLQLPRAI